MNISPLAAKIVAGVAVAIVVNKLTPHVESVLDDVIAKAQKPKEDTE
jgi:hypothetical protein